MTARAGLGGALAFAAIFCVLAASAFAAPQDLDTTFGAGGVAIGGLATGDAVGVAGGTVDEDTGTTIIVGFSARFGPPFVVGYDRLGQRVSENYVDLPAGYTMQSVAFGADRIFLAGTGPGGTGFIARARLNGLLDMAWGPSATPGIRDLGLTDVSAVRGLALQDFGDLAGPRPVALVNRTQGGGVTALVRVIASGLALDAGFATNGVQAAGVGPVGVDLVATPTGIWALGAPSTLNAFTLARYAPADGALATFGTNGRVAGAFPATPGTTTSVPNSLTADAQGRALVAGRWVPADGDARAAIVRYTATGDRDTGFGTDALFTANDPGVPSVADIVADAGGILAAGGEGDTGSRTGRTLVLDANGQQVLGTLRSGAAGDGLHRFVDRNGDGRPVVGGLATAGVFAARFGGPNQAPSITVTGPAKARPGETFTLRATATDDGDGGGLAYEWDTKGDSAFDQFTGAANTLDLSVAAEGPYSASVRVLDASGAASGRAQHQMTIAGNAFPQAVFDHSPMAVTVGATIQFDGSASSDPDGTIMGYAWDFDGDGTQDATGARPIFAYTQKGTFQAKLTVTDDTGATDVEMREIVVTAAGAPPVISALEAVSVGPTTATLRFRIKENGHPAVEPKVFVGGRRFDTGPADGSNRFSADVSGLKPLTNYAWEANVLDGETGATITANSSFTTRNGVPTLSTSIPDTADAGGAFRFTFEAHDDTTTDDKLKVALKVSRPPAEPKFKPTFKGGESTVTTVTFDTPGTWVLDFTVTDGQGVKTKLSETVDVKPTPSFSLSGPTTEVAIAPGSVKSIPIQILRDNQGKAPVKLAVSSPDAPPTVVGNLGGASKFNTKGTATLNLKAPEADAGKTFKVTITGTQQPPPIRDIGPRSITFPVKIIKPVDLVADDLEVLQAVQRPLGSSENYKGLPLVMGKTTLVRAYAHYTKTPAVDVAPAARLYVEGAAQPIAPIHAPTKLFAGSPNLDKVRHVGKGWYHFIVPASVTADKGITKDLDFRVEFDPPLGPDALPLECGNCAGNNTRRRKNVDYIASQGFDVRLVRTEFKDGLTKKKKVVDENEASKAIRATRWVLPIAPARFRVFLSAKTLNIGTGGTEYCRAQAEANADDPNDTDDVADEFSDCRSDLQDYAFDILYASGIGKPPDGALLMVHENFTPGVARSGQGIAQVSTKAPLTSVAHEITHIIGREHADTACGGDDNGQDGEVITDDFGSIQNAYGLLYPADAPWEYVGDTGDYDTPPYDYMSYCAGPAWTSAPGWKLNYEKLFENQSRRAAPLQAPTGGLRVSAIVSGETPRLSRVRPARPGEMAPAGTPSDHSFIARDGQGAVLAEVPGVIAVEDRPHEGGAATVPVLAILPEGTRSIDLVRGAVKLDTRDASASAPVVQVATPTAVLGGSTAPVEVTWTASDPDGDPLDVVVDYSADGGATWEAVHAGIASGAGGTASLDPRALRSTTRAKLRVTVIDGFRSATAESGVFSSKAAPTTVSILQPGRKVRPRAGQSLMATANAIAPDGTPLTGTALRWFLGKRAIGTGEEILTPPLPAGKVRLRVVARGAGAGASASRTLSVAGVKPFFTALQAVRGQGRRATVRVAASAPGTVRIAGQRFRVGPAAKRLRVTVPRRKRRLAVTLQATGGRATATVRLRR